MGNSFRGDDAAGLEMIRLLSRLETPLSLLRVGENPENYLIQITSLNPDTIILVDAADFKASPGTLNVILPDELTLATISTHTMSLKLVAKYLEKETKARVLVFGIQPQRTKLGEKISPEVKNTLEEIAVEIKNLYKNSKSPQEV